MKYSKTKTSFYRRLYIAFLIDSGCNTVTKLLEATGMHRRTLQDTLKALDEIDIELSVSGGTKATVYAIADWGGINKTWVENNAQQIQNVLSGD